MDSNPDKCLTVVAIGPSGGGIRKTKAALLLGSLAKAAGRNPIFVCADPGIGSLNASLKVGGPNSVELLSDEEDPNYARVLTDIANERQADTIIIDLGANAMLFSKTQRTIRKCLKDFKEAGHRTFVVLSCPSSEHSAQLAA